MSYFAAIFTLNNDEWHEHDLDVDEVETLSDVLDLMENADDEASEAVAIVEHEDEWFGVLRQTANGALRVFLSDADAVAQSPAADVFADYLEEKPDAYEADTADGDLDDPPAADLPDEDDEDDDEDPGTMLELDTQENWVGDADLFADAGVSADDLTAQVDEYGSDTGRVLAYLGERVGFGEQLEDAR